MKPNISKQIAANLGLNLIATAYVGFLLSAQPTQTKLSDLTQFHTPPCFLTQFNEI